MLKIAEKTVYSKGLLPAIKVGGLRQFMLTNMDAWIEQQKLEAPKGAK